MALCSKKFPVYTAIATMAIVLKPGGLSLSVGFFWRHQLPSKPFKMPNIVYVDI
jgi:hypothetical protein